MKIDNEALSYLVEQEALPDELTSSGHIQSSLFEEYIMINANKPQVVVLEGPDKCGKTTFIQKAAHEHFNAALPSRPFKERLIADPATYNHYEKFLEDTQGFWLSFGKLYSMAAVNGKDIYIDRDILSMLAYRGVLNGEATEEEILDQYRKIYSTHYRPTKILYATNKPFAAYDENDPIERQGYEAIRAAYEKVVSSNNLKNFLDSFGIVLIKVDLNEPIY